MLLEIAIAVSSGIGTAWITGRYGWFSKKVEKAADKEINAASEFHERLIEVETKCLQAEAREQKCLTDLWEFKEELTACYLSIEFLAKANPEAAKEIDGIRERMRVRLTHMRTAEKIKNRQVEG